MVPEDPLVQLAAGRSLFRVSDLLELAQMVEESRQKPCKGNYVMIVKAMLSCCPRAYPPGHVI